MAKTELKEKIISLLEMNRDGMSQKKIAENLNTSGPTVKNYLEKLEKEDKVQVTHIGIYNVWKINDIARPPADKILQFAISGLSKIAYSTEQVLKQKVDWKEVGRELGKVVKLDDLILTSRLITAYQVKDILKSGFHGLVAISHEFFNILLTLLGEGELIPPVIFEKENFLIYRISNISYVDCPLVFPILTGYMEYIAKDEIPNLNIDIDYEINKQERFVDVKIHLLS